jgi:hypothetical protein
MDHWCDALRQKLMSIAGGLDGLKAKNADKAYNAVHGCSTLMIAHAQAVGSMNRKTIHYLLGRFAWKRC